MLLCVIKNEGKSVCTFDFLLFICLAIHCLHERNKTGLTGRFTARRDIFVLK